MKKNILIFIGMALLVLIVSCTFMFEYDSLEAHTPYRLICGTQTIVKSETTCLSFRIDILFKTQDDDSLIVRENNKHNKKMRLNINNSLYETIVVDHLSHSSFSGNFTAEFNFENGIKFDPIDDRHTLDLCFMEKDSIINKYRYKHD